MLFVIRNHGSEHISKHQLYHKLRALSQSYIVKYSSFLFHFCQLLKFGETWQTTPLFCLIDALYSWNEVWLLACHLNPQNMDFSIKSPLLLSFNLVMHGLMHRNSFVDHCTNAWFLEPSFICLWEYMVKLWYQYNILYFLWEVLSPPWL